MRRAPRWYERYDHIQFQSTTIRLRKPIKYQMWMKSHASQAMKPLIFIFPAIAIARERPIVAIEPLSQ